MWSKYPDISVLYPDFSMYIISGSCEISVSTIIRVSTCPFHLLRLNLSTKTLTPVDGQVSESGMLGCFLIRQHILIWFTGLHRVHDSSPTKIHCCRKSGCHCSTLYVHR